MALIVAVVLLTLLALALIVVGFVAVFREHTMRTPWSYWTWAIVSVLVMSALVDSPMWVRWANFAILLVVAGLWVKDWKEATR
ncbi:membrane protein [Streptomyces phage Keanu]|nr:membrane protein [Streptomyces phage Keanu]